MKKILIYYCRYLLIIPFCLVLLAEVSLFFLERHYHWSSLQTLSTYPSNPSKYFKVAIFGESSALGQFSSIGFEAILRERLKRSYPDNKIYIHNYAKHGYPFHGFQAEILKANIRRYDLSIIYAGHSDAWGYLDSIGFPSKSGLDKHVSRFKILPEEDFNFIYQFLNSNSRVYAVLRNFQISRESRIPPKPEDEAKPPIAEILPEKYIPLNQVTKLGENFGNDLVEIGQIAKKHNRHVIVAPVVGNMMMRPFVSAFDTKTLSSGRENIWKSYSAGVDAFNAKHYKDALAHLFRARSIDSSVAIVSYYIGMSYFKLGEREKGVPYLHEAMDFEVLPTRGMKSFHEKAASLAQNKFSEHLHYIDMFSEIQGIANKDFEIDSFFADREHPSLITHALFAYRILCQVTKLSPFKTSQQTPALEGEVCRKMTSRELLAVSDKLKTEFKVSDAKEAELALGSVRWFMFASYLAAHPEDFLELAIKRLDTFRIKSEQTPQNSFIWHLYLAAIEAQKKQPDMSKIKVQLTKVIKIAAANKSIQVELHLSDYLGMGNTIKSVLKKAGITYSEPLKTFIGLKLFPTESS